MSGRPRKQLPMSDEEIRREYRLAKDPKKQLEILADENCCSVGTILRIVNEKRKQETELSGFVPIQELVEKEAEKEKNMIVIEPAPTTPTADPEWPPLPSAPPQAAADFDELGPSSLPDVQDIPEASAEAGREAKYVRDWRGLLRTIADNVRETCIHSPESGAEPAEAGECGHIYRISGADLSRMWHILGRLQGVLEASAEAGKPGEVMKDACDALEVILGGIQRGGDQ